MVAQYKNTQLGMYLVVLNWCMRVYAQYLCLFYLHIVYQVVRNIVCFSV